MSNGPFYAEGRYKAQILKQALGESSNKGTPQIAIRFKVLEFEDGSPVDAQYERTLYRYITENTIEYVVQDLKQLGYTRDSFRFIDPNQPNFHDFTGQEFIAYCQHEEYNGNWREKWSVGLSGSNFEVKPLESKKLRDLDNMFGKQLKAQAAPAPKQTRQPVAAGVGDDDVPF